MASVSLSSSAYPAVVAIFFMAYCTHCASLCLRCAPNCLLSLRNFCRNS